jgi:hypothetical protein
MKQWEDYMANELNSALRTTADRVAKYVENVATLTVITRMVDIQKDGQSFTDAKAAARTIISLDGDSSVDLPMRISDDGSPVVDAALFELHERNVSTAIEYRARMMDALLQTLRPSARG